MLKKLMNKKKNNKGFSLVELIVVVLIIAIIAVALAPQVMKWVGTSKENVDKNNAAALKSAISTAVAEAQSKGWSVKIDDATKITKDNYPYVDDASIADFKGCIGNVLNGDYPTPSAGGSFTVKVTESGGVTIGTVTPTPTTTP